MIEAGLPIVIVGAGASGTLLAVQLARHKALPVLLIERTLGRQGCGVAFGTAHPDHILNVRAAGMSAFPDERDHFAQWLAASGRHGPTDFVPRGFYGAYLCALLAEAKHAVPGGLATLGGDVVAIVPEGNHHRVQLGDGRTIAARAVILSPGNLPPSAPDWLADSVAASGRYIDDPWADDVADRISKHETVVILGTGLTAVDAALRLESAGFAGRILCLSRRGLAPHQHRDGTIPMDLRDRPPAPVLSALVREIRARARLVGWHGAVDELRPVTQALWAAAPQTVKARFLRHLRPYWDIHRHRLAPAIAARFEALVQSGTVALHAGRVRGVALAHDGLDLSWQPRGGAERHTIKAGAVINCTGPQTDIRRSREPLLHQLLASGTIRPDPLALGIDVDQACRVIGADGHPNDTLYCIGPMTRGTFWEIVAIPDIRHQCAALAAHLAHNG